MKTILHENNQYILRFDPGEEVVSTLKDFCKKERIFSGVFQGIGACDKLKLSYYDLKLKKYVEKDFNQDLEITNLTGNVAMHGEDIIIHMHGNLGDTEFQALGGHVMAITISVTGEIYLTKFDQPVNRKPYLDTPLKLLD